MVDRGPWSSRSHYKSTFTTPYTVRDSNNNNNNNNNNNPPDEIAKKIVPESALPDEATMMREIEEARVKAMQRRAARHAATPGLNKKRSKSPSLYDTLTNFFTDWGTHRGKYGTD